MSAVTPISRAIPRAKGPSSAFACGNRRPSCGGNGQMPTNMMAAPFNTATNWTLTEAWAEWLRLSDVAHRSHDLKDGIAAGRAWGRFLALFDPRPRVQTSDAEIVPLRVR